MLYEHCCNAHLQVGLQLNKESLPSKLNTVVLWRFTCLGLIITAKEYHQNIVNEPLMKGITKPVLRGLIM